MGGDGLGLNLPKGDRHPTGAAIKIVAPRDLARVTLWTPFALASDHHTTSQSFLRPSSPVQARNESLSALDVVLKRQSRTTAARRHCPTPQSSDPRRTHSRLLSDSSPTPPHPLKMQPSDPLLSDPVFSIPPDVIGRGGLHRLVPHTMFALAVLSISVL